MQKRKSSRFTEEMDRALVEGYGKHQVNAELKDLSVTFRVLVWPRWYFLLTWGVYFLCI